MLAPPGPMTVGFGPHGGDASRARSIPASSSTRGPRRPAGPARRRIPAEEGVFKPYELPIAHAPAYGPTGQDGDDCQAGQLGYTQGRLLVPGQPVSSPTAAVADIPGSRGPTTVFFDEDGDRVLRDSRVPSRQP